jgi:hypothetical protein
VLYPKGFRIPVFVRFTGDDARTTYDHVGQFLVQVNDTGINDVHRVKLFPLSLSRIALNWFTSLAPNSTNTWAEIEDKFHKYFYNGETELKLSYLTTVRQKYIETVAEYIKQFRGTRNKCYSLTIREKDLAHFIPISHLYTVALVALVFMETVYELHGMPAVIILDRDPVFTSKFWGALFKQAGTTLKMSSSYHP